MLSFSVKTTLPERLVKFPETRSRSEMLIPFLISKTYSDDNWFAPERLLLFNKTTVIEVLMTLC